MDEIKTTSDFETITKRFLDAIALRAKPKSYSKDQFYFNDDDVLLMIRVLAPETYEEMIFMAEQERAAEEAESK